MKRKSKIKILKDNDKESDSYTFVEKSIEISTFESNINQEQIGFEEKGESLDLDKIYKKKKVLTNQDMAKSSRGLKYTNPSQRNHSSVYE
ncbi:hypothetical protein [Candidatus Nitrosocosmicus sp. SS]|jgi:hypothetical protein|uniref:hypothetical protein n=1 Tax=Candidatus Nitrosocosmicus agrestis TaxID=2563600 RepID=UPI00122E297F|nr:hypothetical protein [Candidatus Nitrosocosmicus sp. SS]KAA2281218.1 hypothetical protein F1Z66_08850 [Candidatus Nitrosocosmicus sp. SS]KAF0868366.1 hypothetical protein E5N71_10450 [Candidatus Nitrosocosmicus sp. SS]